MGFFSTKKNENSDASFMDSDKSVVQIIRSRFVSGSGVIPRPLPLTSQKYGKSKGKEREIISSPVISSPRSPGTHRSGERLIPVNGKNSGLLKKAPPHTIAPNITKPPENLPSPLHPPTTDAITYVLHFSLVFYCLNVSGYSQTNVSPTT